MHSICGVVLTKKQKQKQKKQSQGKKDGACDNNINNNI